MIALAKLGAVWTAEVTAARQFGVMFSCCFPLVAILISLAILAFWIYCIIEVATKEPAEDPNKIIWLLVVILINPIGGIIYLLVRRPERRRKYGR